MRVVLLERDSVKAEFRQLAGCHEWLEYDVSTQAELLERLRGAQIAIVNKLRIGAAELAELPELRMIAVAATGADNVDLAECARRGVVVSNVRGYAVNTVPEHAMMLMLALRRKLFEYVSDVREGQWSKASTFCLFHHPVGDLHGASLGLIGSGALGEGVARLAEVFGMRILRSERKGADSVRAGRVAFDEVLRQSDVVSLHCPLTPQTRGLIGEAELSAMPSHAILINTARGGLCDEAALADALRAGVIAGAAVDVLSSEPPEADHPLLASDIPNLIVTPHMAWASAGAMQALADQVIHNIEAFVAGTPRNLLA